MWLDGLKASGEGVGGLQCGAALTLFYALRALREITREGDRVLWLRCALWLRLAPALIVFTVEVSWTSPDSH